MAGEFLKYHCYRTSSYLITSDVEDLKFIGDNLYGSWIELAQFTEEFDDETIMRELKEIENQKNKK